MAPAVSGSGTPNNFLFQGQQYDPSSSDYYLRARYYDQSAGRFLSQDPFAGIDTNPLSLHRYLYASNDPVNRVDPGGAFDFSLNGSLATIASISALTAFYTGAILLNPAPANAPGPNDTIYRDHSTQDTFYYIVTAELGGRALGYVGSKALGYVGGKIAQSRAAIALTGFYADLQDGGQGESILI